MLTLSLVCFYECTIWSYLQVSYKLILLREAYIANTRNHTSGTQVILTSATASFTYKAELCRRPPPPIHARTHDTRACRHIHMSSYVNEI